MALRLLILAWYGCLVLAGPVAWDTSKCSQECSEGSKYQYSPQTTYIYSYESSNELQSESTTELSSGIQATVEISSLSKCEMILEIKNVKLQHGPLEDKSSTLITELTKHPLPFSFNEGVIDHVCPSPEDSSVVKNVKKGILSAFQNSMKNLDYDAFNRETDILGDCDTEYIIKEQSGEKYVIQKNKNVATCSNHLKIQTVLIASYYESASQTQHLPLLSNQSLSCRQVIDKGVVEEVTCEETASFKPLSEYGYVVSSIGKTKLHKLSSKPANRVTYQTPKKESLAHTFEHHEHTAHESDALDVLRELCEKTDGLLEDDVGKSIHTLVYLIRSLDEGTLKDIYSKVKNNEICNSHKLKTIFTDALKAASSGGSISLLTQLIANHEISEFDAILWMSFMPFTSYVDAGSIEAVVPLIKNAGNRPALLGASAMTYKYCLKNKDCESQEAVQHVSSSIQSFLKDKCQTSDDDSEIQILTALKAFGNLGYIGGSKASILECATNPDAKMHIRVAAVEAFRRSPCTEEITSSLLDLYKNTQEEDEVRIASLISLSKCATIQVIKRVAEVYSTETSKQVEVFTWSYLNNIQTTNDPLKAKLQQYTSRFHIKTPESTDITKFSRNFEWSYFSERLNLGHGIKGNVIHSKSSFIPRSGNLALNFDGFGNQLNLIETGGRFEDLEHMLEKLFGPRRIDAVEALKSFLGVAPARKKRSADSYNQKIDALTERLNYQRGADPHGSAYIRIMGHEMMWLQLNKNTISKFGQKIDVIQMLQKMADVGNIDLTRNLLFSDVSILIPSVTGKAYKLSANASALLGLKLNGKIDLKQPNLRRPQAHIEGRFQVSLSTELSASLTIHSEDFEPGVKVATTLNAGLDFEPTIEMKDGHLLHVKLKRPIKDYDMMSLRRKLYAVNHKGQWSLPEPQYHSLDYCTKYTEHILGLKYCTKVKIPHIFNAQKKPKIPIFGPYEFTFSVKQMDLDMEGYEGNLEFPESLRGEDRNYKISFDTPKSSVNRKFSAEVMVHNPSSDSYKMSTQIQSPFYSVDFNTQYLKDSNAIHMKVEALGDQRRKYVAALDIGIDERGARLVEYQPKLSVSLPGREQTEFSGTIIYSRGRKAQISINLSSNSFEKEFSIKGNIAKEGETSNVWDEWRLVSDMSINAFSQIHRIHSSAGNVESGLFLDASHHYEPDGRSYESVTLSAVVKDIKFKDGVSFTLENKLLLAEHQDINSFLKWDFSFNPTEHLKNYIAFRYGENFDDDTHLIRIVQINELHGDFHSFKEMHIENQLGVTISCFDFDKSVSFSGMWDVVDKPKVVIDIGLKLSKEKKIGLDFKYNHLSKKPLKLNTEARVTYFDYVFTYNEQMQEISNNEYQAKVLIEPSISKQVTIDYVYRIKSDDEKFHHELDGTIVFPGVSVPVQQKALLSFTKDNFEFSSYTDIGSQSPYVIDAKLKRKGVSEVKLNMPLIEGRTSVNTALATYTIQADFKTKGRDDRHIIASGSITPGDVSHLDLDILWDADKDSKKKLILKSKLAKDTEDGQEKHIVTANINYVGSINVDVTGKLSTHLLSGPHYFRADFSGNMEPMALVYSHEISNGQMNSVAQYLRNDVEKIRADIKGKLVRRAYHFEFESGVYLSSPYKTFDGKELYYRLYLDSNTQSNSFASEYRIKPTAYIGYVGKIDYARKRGWPGNIKSSFIVTVHRRPRYEGSTHVEYGNGKYSWKSRFTPISKKNYVFESSFEHASRFAAFRHTLVTSLQYLQTIQVNAVADLRQSDDLQLQSNVDFNEHKLYDVNATLKTRSVIDFEYKVLLLGKITPSLHIYSNAQTTNQLTKYDMSLEVDSVTIITGTGELKKRKKGFNSDMTFKYKDTEFLVVTVNQDAKSQREKHYVIKIKTPNRSYTSNVDYLKEKKSVKYATKFCVRDDSCVNVDVIRKDSEDKDEYVVTYRRAHVELSLERIRVDTVEMSRYHTVLFSGDKRYGYDLRLANEGYGKSVSLGIILPSREIITKGNFGFSLKNPKMKFELSADGKNHPERKVVADIQFENHIFDDSPSKLDISIAHPIFEKPIEMKMIGNYDSSEKTFLTAEMSLDYSTDPEDKIISKLSAERTHGRSGNLLLNIYHKDDQHLDFVMKANHSMNVNEEMFGLIWNWKGDSDEDVEAHIIARYPSKDRKFYFEYLRPTLSYKLEGEVVSPSSLLGQSYEVVLTSIYNGEATKANMVADLETGCRLLTIFDDGGQKTREIKMCLNLQSRKLFSIRTESFDEDQEWVFDYLFEILHKSLGSINIRHHWNPEFLGGLVFTSLTDDLQRAGVGTVPFYDSPRFKLIRNSFNSKVFHPLKEFIIPESEKLKNDLHEDFEFLGSKIKDYYNKLPTRAVLIRYLEYLRSVLEDAYDEVSVYVVNYLRTHYEYVIVKVEKIIEQVQEHCSNNLDCRYMVRAYKSNGLPGVLEQLKRILLELPERLQAFFSGPGNFGEFFKSLLRILKVYLEPLTKNRCGEIVVKVSKLLYEKLSPHVESLASKLFHLYKEAKEEILKSPYTQKILKRIEEECQKFKESFKRNMENFYHSARKWFEEYLTTVSLPTMMRFITVNTINSERGILDLDIHFPVDLSVIKKLGSIIRSQIQYSFNAVHRFNWNSLLVTFKRGADFNFFPPYSEQALIVDNHHFITFDKTFYDFAGECSYLLSRDFEDGNFTIALKPKEKDQTDTPSIVVLVKDTTIQLNTESNTVIVDEQAVDLPVVTDHTSVIRKGNNIIIKDKYGIKIKCHLSYHVCNVIISGWYYGKTAGLLGTYNYEPSDDFKRPKGQIASNPSVFAKSWELKRGCKTTNLVPDVQINKNSEYYKLCESHFKHSTSSLSACFSEVKPDEYFQLCLRHLARVSDTKQALCKVAMAYVLQCERNYVEINLPPKCLTCEAPGGVIMQHGDRKKFEGLKKRSADIVFVVEDHSCNKVIANDLNSLALSIDRELKNEGFKDNTYSVVGYGGKMAKPMIYTNRGRTLFSAREINTVTERFKLDGNDSVVSSPFDAMKLAITYLFRSDTARNFILLSCTPCKYDYKSLQYPVVQQILLERGISLHVITNQEVHIKKSAVKEKKGLIGADPDTVYHIKDVTQKDLTGEPELRSQVSLPKDLCVALSQDVNGSFFSTNILNKGSTNDAKNWRSVFARKFSKAIQVSECQWCDCTSSPDHTASAICQPCETKRPRLPFSVCKSCIPPRFVEAFLSYLLHLWEKFN